MYISTYLYTRMYMGHAVAQLVEALGYKPEGRGFDSRWCRWNFSLTYSFRPHYGPGVDSASKRNEYQESINFMVTPCINNNQHFNFQLMHTTLKNAELLKNSKISKTAPTCFGLQGNHHQGATIST